MFEGLGKSVRGGVLAVGAIMGFGPAPAMAQTWSEPSPTGIGPSAARAAAADEAWWTGPVATASADTLPRGHVLFEPYLLEVRSTGATYDGSLTYLLYGVTDRLTLCVVPTIGTAHLNGYDHRGRVAVNDLTVRAHYRLYHAPPSSPVPTVALLVQRIVPLGRFDRLADPQQGIGSGSAVTQFGVYMQWYARLANRHLLRTRLDLIHGLPGTVSVRGASVFGTPDNFAGRVRVGPTTTVMASAEYSLSRSWVLANDLIYDEADGFRARADAAGGGLADAPRPQASWSLRAIPAVEYSWADNRGILVGVRTTLRHHNAPSSVTPVVGFNAVF